MNRAVIYKNPFAVPCETYACGNTATYVIGRQDVDMAGATLFLCDECIKSIAASVPEHMRPVAEPEVVSKSEETSTVNPAKKGGK